MDSENKTPLQTLADSLKYGMQRIQKRHDRMGEDASKWKEEDVITLYVDITTLGMVMSAVFNAWNKENKPSKND